MTVYKPWPLPRSDSRNAAHLQKRTPKISDRIEEITLKDDVENLRLQGRMGLDNQ